jgi:hypothetical protein
MPPDTERGGEDTPAQKLILVVEDDDAHGQMLLLVIEQETPIEGSWSLMGFRPSKSCHRSSLIWSCSTINFRT